MLNGSFPKYMQFFSLWFHHSRMMPEETADRDMLPGRLKKKTEKRPSSYFIGRSVLLRSI